MRLLRYIFSALLVLAVVGGGAGLAVYQHYAAEVPDFAQLKDYQPDIVSRVHAGDGRLLAEFATEKRVFVPFKAIPPRLVQAVLAAEDREFYNHGGVDFLAILRASVTNLLHLGSNRRKIGASTITQQVVKNMLLSNEYSYSRKIREAILAIRIEQAFSKEQILELYLNETFFGNRAYGVAAAALNYFNKSLDDLTLAEAAYLAAVVKGPTVYDPIRHYDAAKTRRDYVLDGMAKIGAVTEDEARDAEAQPIVTKKPDETQVFSSPYFTEDVRRELIARFGEPMVYRAGLSVRTSLDPNLQVMSDRALRDGLMAYDRRHGWRGPVAHLDAAALAAGWPKKLAAVGLPPGGAPWKLALVREVGPASVTIGLVDGSGGVIPMSELAWARPVLDDQRYGNAPKSPADVLNAGDVVLVEPVSPPPPVAPAHADRAHPAAAEKPAIAAETYGLRQIPDVSGALVALDPHTGRVLAMSGGWSAEMSQFNRATQAKRQIGSTMKPFAYLAALENGMTPSTMILCAPVEIDQGPGLPKWRPKNFESSEDVGALPLRRAIEKSINTMTVRMAATVGIDKIAPYVERLGIMDKMPLEYSMVLGAGETTPLRLTAAYAMLVNGGKKITPSLIDQVQDRNGQTLFRHDDRACPHCDDFAWAPPGEVPDLPDTREQVLDPGTAYQMVHILEGVVQRGTAASAVGAKLHRPLAGKTGTTNDANEAWFVGFSPDLVAGVYVGFDQPRTLGPREQGASVAAPIFAEFMGDALKDKPPVEFRQPPGIRMVRVDAATGQLADSSDHNVIWEAFKPGTEPSDQIIDGGQGVQTIGANSEGDGSIPLSALPTPGENPPASSPTPAPPPLPRSAPSTGTGGLY